MFGAFVPVLIHAPTNWEFVFDFDPQHGLHAAQWSPGEETPKDKTYNLDWPLMRRAVDLWLANIKRERSSPDLWAQLDKQRELLASTVPFKGDDGDNSPFNAVEQAQISAQLDGIRELLVREHQVDSRVLESIEELREASTRIGRKEWLTIFIGTIFMWGFGGLVPFDGARQALTLVTHGIGHLFGGGLVQLPAT